MRPQQIENIKDAQRSITNLYKQLTDLTRHVKTNNITTDDTNNSLSGTLVIDDGANWRLTLKFYKGKLVNVVTAASTGATLSWT